MTYANRLTRNLRTTAPGVVYDENIADARDRAMFPHPLSVVGDFVQHARQWLEAELIEDARDVEEALEEWYGPTYEWEAGKDSFVQALGWGHVFRQYRRDFGEAPRWPSDLYEYAAMDLVSAVAGMVRDLASGLELDEE